VEEWRGDKVIINLKRMKFFTVLFVGLTLMACPLLAQEVDSANLLNTGVEMPEFKLNSLDGKTITSDDLYGKVVLINFFATWCPPCNMELPQLQKDVWEKYKDNGDFVLLVVDREETAEKVSSFVRKKKYTMPFYLDPKREVYGLFATQYIPRNYLFNRESQLVLVSKGYSKEDFATLKREVDALVKR